jgi:dihydrofolate reductase
MGRNTYEYFAPAWSVMTGAYPERINAIRKYVFSSTLTSAKWNNSVIIAGDPVPTVAELKDRDGADQLAVTAVKETYRVRRGRRAGRVRGRHQLLAP